MAYGHAERNLALIRQLEAETRQLLESLNQPDAEQSAVSAARPAMRRNEGDRPGGPPPGEAVISTRPRRPARH
jgi:hypothetical protein